MSKDKKNSDPKYFYTVVLITVAIIGFVVWEVFISDYEHDEIMIDHSLQRFPNIDLVFLDSYFFQNLNTFHRGDSPFLLWDKVLVENPFHAPRIPTDSRLREWWENFNLVFKVDDDGWTGIFPDRIAGERNPEVFLFEGRWYEITIENFSGEEHDFKIEDSAGDIVFDSGEIADKREEKFEFKAEDGMVSYFSSFGGGMRGDIVIIGKDDYDTTLEDYQTEGEREAENLLMRAGEKLTEFHRALERVKEFLEEDIRSEMEENYSEFEERFRDIEERYSRGELTVSSLRQSIGQYESDIEEKIKKLEELVDDFTEFDEAEEIFQEVENAFASFLQMIEDLDDPEIIMRAENEYALLREEVEEIKNRYEEVEFTPNELRREINEFYLRAEEKIEELGLIN